MNRNPKLGPARLLKIKKVLKDWSLAWEMDEWSLAKRLEPEIVKYILEARKKVNPDRELQIVQRLGLTVLSLGDKKYPKLLSEIPDPPIILYVKGDPGALDNLNIAVVGSRRCSPYGLQMATRIAEELAGAGAAVISGLALGIDGAAHTATLQAGGITVAVLGNGLDQIFPSSHSGLARRITESGGAIISEYAPGTPGLKFNFPLRNRIIAGLSKAVVVVEADLKSGALYTASAGLDYNREVLAVPGDVTRSQAAGCNRLIQMGARLVTSAQDIFDALEVETKVSQKTAQKAFPDNPTEEAIYAMLDSSISKNLDEIIRACKLPAADVGSAITLMEIKGLIRNQGAGNYVLET